MRKGALLILIVLVTVVLSASVVLAAKTNPDFKKQISQVIEPAANKEVNILPIELGPIDKVDAKDISIPLKDKIKEKDILPIPEQFFTNCSQFNSTIYANEDIIMSNLGYCNVDLPHHSSLIVTNKSNITIDCGLTRFNQSVSDGRQVNAFIINNSNVTVKNCILDNFYYGFVDYSSWQFPNSNVIIKNNSIKNSGADGIQFNYTYNSIIRNNTILYPRNSGISLSSNNSSVSYNTIYNLYSEGLDNGISCSINNNTKIFKNNIHDSNIGIYFYYSFVNIIGKNTISNVSNYIENDTSDYIIDEEGPYWWNIDVEEHPAIPDYYIFNSTWTDKTLIDDVILELDGVNYSYKDGELGYLPPYANKYNMDMYIGGDYLLPGIHNYRWYAKDIVDNWNATPVYNYTILDTTPPVRANGAPAGTITTTYTTMSLTTNEDATCRYSGSPNTAYISMDSSTTTSWGTSHSWSLTNLVNGDYNYYIRCNDTVGNYNTDDYPINFTVLAGNFKYKKKVQITENSGYNLTDYPIIFWFGHKGYTNSECSDVRIINNITDNSTIPFGMRNCNSTHIELVGKFDLLSYETKYIDIYYGNITPVSFANSTWNDVRYNFWDEFDGDNLDTEKWTESSSADCQLTFFDDEIHDWIDMYADSTGHCTIYSRYNFSDNSLSSITNWSYNMTSDYTMRVYLIKDCPGNFIRTERANRTGYPDKLQVEIEGTTTTTDFNIYDIVNTWYNGSFYITPSSQATYRDGILISPEQNHNNLTFPANIALEQYAAIDMWGEGSFDYIYHYKYIDPEPTVKIVQYSFQLQPGDNFISVAYKQYDTSLTRVLESIDGKYDYVWYYDANDKADHWKTYATFKPPSLNDLWTLDSAMGFWINVNGSDPVMYRVYGIDEPSTQIELKQGQNMVGYPSFTSRTVEDALQGLPWTSVEGFDENAEYNLRELAPTELMGPNNGYWINVTEDCAWVVDW